MTRRRKVVLGAVACAAVAVGVVAANLHWRLYGWWRGEPFCDGLPASYYAARIRAVWVVRDDLGGSVRPRQYSTAEAWLRGHRGAFVADVVWPESIDTNSSPHPFRGDTADGSKMPVLLVLLSDPDLRVRWWASEKLSQVTGDSVPESVVALERLLHADDVTDRFLGAMALGRRGRFERSALPALRALRGDETRVPWFSMTLGALADSTIQRIDADTARDVGGR